MAEFQVARSPWGPDDEIGALNLITPDRRSSALAQVDGAASRGVVEMRASS
jgi:hypothetical protein